ncbi:MAG: glycosyltransferase [Candidatus Dadabacteria bacterium]|nr:glycosyltransferase [Candidatus Dadabacteria bacterium]
MKICVIIPTFNRSSVVSRAIDSALAQTRPPAEVIVVDDGSTDYSAHVLDLYNGIRVISKRNGGVSHARNSGIRASRGEWLAFLDSDDEWLPKKLEAQVRYHTENPSVLISQTEEIWIRGSRRVNARKKHRKQGGWIFNSLLPLSLVSPSAVMIHRSVFEDVGLFDEGFPVCEDYDLWLRISKKYYIGLVPERLIIKYGGRSDQLSRKLWGMDRWRVRALEKHIHNPGEFAGGFSESYDTVETRWAILTEIIRKSNIIAKGAGKRKNNEIFTEFSAKAQYYRKLIQGQEIHCIR